MTQALVLLGHRVGAPLLHLSTGLSLDERASYTRGRTAGSSCSGGRGTGTCQQALASLPTCCTGGTEWPSEGLEGRAEQRVAKGRQVAISVARLIYNSSFQNENPFLAVRLQDLHWKAVGTERSTCVCNADTWAAAQTVNFRLEGVAGPTWPEAQKAQNYTEGGDPHLPCHQLFTEQDLPWVRPVLALGTAAHLPPPLQPAGHWGAGNCSVCTPRAATTACFLWSF